MRAKLSSRQQRNFSPSLTTLTRNKSEIFFHRNRSGLIRPDSGPRHKPSELPLSRRGRKRRSLESDDKDREVVLEESPCKKTKLNVEVSSSSVGEEDELSMVMTKDLRARRVYSPRSTAGACSGLVKDVFSKGSGVDSDCGDRRVAGLGFGLKPSVENDGCEKEGLKVEVKSDNMAKVFSPESQVKNDEVNSVLRLVLNEYRSDVDSDLYADYEAENSDLGLSPEAPNSEMGSAEPSDDSKKLQDEKQIVGISLEKIGDLTGEPVQTTPPDAVICVHSEGRGYEDKHVDEVHANDTHVTGNAVEKASKGSCPKDSQRNGSVLKNKSVLRPRLPGKLFQAPGSVSFKKLFPFLKDIMRVGSDMPSLEASKHELMTETPCMSNAYQSQVSEGGAIVTPVNELSHADESQLGSSPCLLESTMQLPTKEVIIKHLSVPSECSSESRADSIAEFHCVEKVGNALHKDVLKQDSKNNGYSDNMKATNHGGCASDQFGVLNEGSIQTTPLDTEASNKSEVKWKSGSPDLYNVKVMDTSRSNQENVEGFCLKTDNRKGSAVKKTKSVSRLNLHRKLFKNPGSVNYNRLLPYLKDFTRDDNGHRNDHTKDEVNMRAKRFQLPLSSPSQEASMVEHKIDSGPLPGTIESNALVNNLSVDPIVEISHSNQSSLTSSQDLPEVFHECLSSPAVNEYIEKVEIGSSNKCPIDSKFEPDSVMVDLQSVDDVPSALHKVGLEQVKNKISGEHNSLSPPKAQNVLYIDGKVSDLSFENHSSKEKGFSIECDKRKQFFNLENCDSAGKYPPEGQSLDNLDPIMPDAEDNEKGSQSICRSDDAVVLNHAIVSNEESRPSSEKIILEKSDIAGHGVQQGGSVLKGIVYGPKMPSKGSVNKTASRVGRIGSSTESNTTLPSKLLIHRCSRTKLMKLGGSLNLKRMFPYLSDTLKDNSCGSANGHRPKVQKCLDQNRLLPHSDSDTRGTPSSDSNGCVPREHCTGTPRTQRQAGFHACHSNAKVRQSRTSHDSRKVTQLQGGQVVSNGRYNGAINREEAKASLPETSNYFGVRGNSSSLIPYNGEKPPQTHEYSQSLSPVTASGKPRTSAVGMKKGILKRNPRGCRGLCTCLNCASFRLHAVRAFEFSRNQFQDAEEVAQDLMTELSQLRNILERSDDSANDNPVSEVKEACKKAFVAEQLARDRLSQMNDDLNIHCRISNLQRPRVRFSDHVEEKVFHPDK